MLIFFTFFYIFHDQKRQKSTVNEQNYQKNKIGLKLIIFLQKLTTGSKITNLVENDQLDIKYDQIGPNLVNMVLTLNNADFESSLIT